MIALVPTAAPAAQADLADDGGVAVLVAAAARFAPATAELLARRELLRRVDTKFVAPIPAVAAIIERIVPAYAALTVPSGNVASYRSLYFDTPERDCFHAHRRGRRIRHKIRIRHYPDRALTFLEVKTKRNEQVTDKHRIALAWGAEQLGDAERAFLAAHVGLAVDELRPVMRIDFRRVSLVGADANERVTIDLGLTAEELAGGQWGFGGLAVIEVKQAPFCVRTPVMRAVRGAGLREQSMSKYTIATAAMHPELRRNRLLPDLRATERRLV
ncbi:MAG TPA: VTC domain-containing protein [Kofleriaceae bacterium]|nr:VTC domain-containing protein [Kofleriaceae bacterium]